MKKADYKKTLVRNTVQPTQKYSTVSKEKNRVDKTDVSKNISDHHCKLNKPELQSTLKLEKTIDNITKHRKTEVQNESVKLAVDEKVFT